LGVAVQARDQLYRRVVLDGLGKEDLAVFYREVTEILAQQPR
jgi:hypothetical protein